MKTGEFAMAAEETDDGRSSITQTHDQRPAPGAMNPALGRTSEDLATDSPAGLGPEPLAGDESDQFSGDDLDNEGQGTTRGPKRNPDISPDERLGLRPTIKGDAAPDTPVNPDLYGA
jgi:hypothetical protein